MLIGQEEIDFKQAACLLENIPDAVARCVQTAQENSWNWIYCIVTLW